MTPDLNRRDALKGLTLGAGATLLTPILGQLRAHAAGEPAAVRKRVVFVLQTNGMNPAHLLPSGVERPRNGRPTNDRLEETPLAGRTLHTALEPLTPFQDRLALVQGLSGRIALNDHSTNHGCLGCYPGKTPMAATIDNVLSEALPGIFPHVAVGYGGDTEPMSYAFCASGPGKAVPIITSPDLAFRTYFGSVAEGAGRQAFDRRTNLLDFMADDVRRSRESLAAPQREKFDHYLRAFENLHARQRELVAKADDLRHHAPRLGEKQTTGVSSLILEAQFEIAAATLLAGLTNVVTITSGGGNQRFGKFPEFGIPDLHHIGHGGSYNGKTYEECFVELRRFHTRLIAGLARRLADTPEGNGTMLDNTVIVYLSDSGEGHHPRLEEWPVVLLGNMGGRLNTAGRYLQFPAYGTRRHRTMANLYCTLLHAAGRPRDTFGVADPGLRDLDQKGTVQELLA
jgi:hypothetical protein